MHSSSAVRMAVGCLVELAFKVAAGELRVSVCKGLRHRLGRPGTPRRGGWGSPSSPFSKAQAFARCQSQEEVTVPGSWGMRGRGNDKVS